MSVLQTKPSTEIRLSVYHWVGAALVVAGFLPLMYWHVAGLLERPHYQFLFLFPIAVGLLYSTLPEISTQGRSNAAIVIAACLGAVVLAGLGFATWAWSPWVAAVCFLVSLPTVLLYLGGWPLVRDWYPLWGFFLILIPLPFGLDEDLIVRLRSVTCRATSVVLDQVGVVHGSFANVIELPGKPLFVADACSGIHSLYVLLAIALFASLCFRRTNAHSLLLILSTAGFVLVENIARIASVAVAWRYGHDWSEGTSHTVLGATLFCISVLIVLSMDQFLLFLLPTSVEWFRKAISGSRELGAGKSTQRRSAVSSVSGGLEILGATMAVLFPIAGVFQFSKLPDRAPNALAVFKKSFELPPLRADVLPAALGGYTQTDFETIQRVSEDPFGKSSQRWTFTKDNITVYLSLDYPYEGPKDLCECYELVGWSLSGQRVYSQTEIATLQPGSSNSEPVASVNLHRELYGDAQLYFSSCDLDGNITSLIKSLVTPDSEKRIANRVGQLGAEEDPGNAAHGRNPPYINIHLLAISVDSLSEQERTELLKFFVDARNSLIPVIANRNQTAAGAANE